MYILSWETLSEAVLGVTAAVNLPACTPYPHVRCSV